MGKEERVKEIWSDLDKEGKGWLTKADLELGLRRMHYPLQVSMKIVQQLFNSNDCRDGGKVTREDFIEFVNKSQAMTRIAFEEISKRENGVASPTDFGGATSRDGFRLSDNNSNRSFDNVTHSHQATLSSEEWRTFMSFSPTEIEDVGSSISSRERVFTSNHDGDFHISMAQLKHIEYFVAGALASVTSRTVTAPLDRLKVYLIAQTATSEASDAFKQGKTLDALRYSWRSVRQAGNALWNAGGTYSLWAGNGLNLFKMIPEGAVKFGTYEASRRFFMKAQGVEDLSQISATAQLVSGGIGGVLAQFTAYPIDTLRFRMQCELIRGGPKGTSLITTTASSMWRSGGIKSYYRGLFWGLIGQFPYSALDLAAFEYARQGVTRLKRKRGYKGKAAEPGSVATAAIGGFSSAFGASIVWPLNMLRTRLQMQGTAEHPQTYTGIVDVTKQTIRTEGMKGLFRGIVPNLIKVVPSGVVTYTVWEKSKQVMDLE